jgi:ribosomal peptide maturation radical SAM protein 1
MRVLLIQPPFWAVNSPSLGLSYLQAALRDAGHEADILYSNLDFARRISLDLYGSVQCQLPVDFLFGDLVFGPALQGRAAPQDQVRHMLNGLLAKHRMPDSAASGVIEHYEFLVEAATRFVAEFRESKSWETYDLVGFTTTFSLVPALAMSKAMKQAQNAPPVVFGGCHCDDSLGEALIKNFPWIDYVARGDGEKLVVELAEHLKTGRSHKRSIDGLLRRDSDQIIASERTRAKAEDLDGLPYPDFTNWFTQMAKHGWVDRAAMRLPIETSRGCWYGQKRQCTFCGLNGASLEFRSKKSERVIREYSSLMEYEVPVIYAVDSVLDPRFFKDVIPGIEALPKKGMMFFEVRASHTRVQLAALRNAGIRVLQPGVESLNTRLLGLMNKGTTAFQNVRLLKWTAELAIPVSWNMLCGLPNEEAEDYLVMAELIPSLMHLLPPITESNRIHVDRFSPLFERHLEAIQPIATYSLALGLEPDAVRECAYHFEFDAAHSASKEVEQAINHLRAKIADWQAAIGKVAFVTLSREGRLTLFDSRPGAACGEVQLNELQSQAYQLLGNGCTRNALEEALAISSAEAGNLITEFLQHHWAVELDGKYLALAIAMDEGVPEEVPSTLQGSVATALCCHRMMSLWDAVKN